MVSHSQFTDRIMSDVASALARQKTTATLDEPGRVAVLQAVKSALDASADAALADSEFYQRLNSEMRQGLQSIYKEITSAASGPAKPMDREAAGKLFTEAADQLTEVMTATLDATESIMTMVEGMQDRLLEAKSLLAAIRDLVPAATAERLAANATANEAALTGIMTSLSFQDLTGQRLKKVVQVLGDIRNAIFDMYVSSGLMLKTREEMPEKNIEEIARESRRRMEEIGGIKGSELKGPSKGTSQNDVDSLLADLGL